MDAAAGWSDDPKFNEIVSPLSSNARLRKFIEEFKRREEELRPNDFKDNERTEGYFLDVGRVADYLALRDHDGAFDQWDWAAQFLSNEDFRNLYPADRHWMFDDFISDDAEEFLANQNWESFARTQMTKCERENLLTVLSHFETPSFGSAVLRLQKILAK